MSRNQTSLFGPLAFVLVAAVFAAGAGYTWWLDHRAPAPVASREVRAAALPPPVSTSLPRRTRTAATPPPTSPASVARCIGADGVPIYTSGACPNDARLDKHIAVEVRDPPRRPLAAPASRGNFSANAVALVNNYGGGGGYGIPSRQERRSYALERAYDRCERAKVRERAELDALRTRRKMSDIRRWADHVVHECATYQVLTRRH